MTKLPDGKIVVIPAKAGIHAGRHASRAGAGMCRRRQGYEAERVDPGFRRDDDVASTACTFSGHHGPSPE
jgi:hypothetical protein